MGRPYGRLPDVRYRRGLGARLAGPWSQYLTLGHPATRRVRMTPRASSRTAIPAILAHELAHRYSFDESLTTLRGLELSARLAREDDLPHAHAARRELARMALGAALAEAAAGPGGPAEAEVERFLAERPGDPALARTRAQWAHLRARREAGRGVDCVTTVYSVLPMRALAAGCAAAEAGGSGARAGRGVATQRCGPIPHPRFPLDSLQAWAVAAYTLVDALAGRRREGTPLGAVAWLWEGARGSRPSQMPV